MPRSILRLLLAAVTALACYSPLQGAAEQGVLPETTVFEFVRENPSVNGERRQVMRFTSDGLEQYALVLWPAGQAPAGGWPALLFNHGYHPDPPAYGRNTAGHNDRPGDYYRGVAQAYVDQGMVVVVPDFRGHNASEGLSYTRREDAPRFYARDAVVAFRAMVSLPGVSRSRNYMLGHSMGGLVTLAALGALAGEVTAVSIWSTMAVPQGDMQLGNPGLPMLLQHARGDATTPVSGAQEIASYLRTQGGEVRLYLYDSDDHLFTGDDFDQAVARDLALFEQSGT